MKPQLALFDVPPDAPSAKAKLKVFCKQHGIWTYNCRLLKGEGKWVALLLKKAREAMFEPAEEVLDLIAEYCEALETYHLMVYGETEREAVEELCKHNGIEFKP